MRGLARVMAAIACAGCSVGPDYEPPTLPEPPRYLAPYDPADDAPALWWKGFEDPVLDALIDETLASNLDIEIALARLAEAESFARAELADLFPRLDLFTSGETRAQIIGEEDTIETEAPTGGAFSFVPDIFGRERRALEAARAGASAEAFGVEDARRATAAAVAAQYVEIRRIEARLALLSDAIVLRGRILDAASTSRAGGRAPRWEADTATAALERERAARAGLVIAKARALYAVAALAGEPPRADLVPLARDPRPPVYAGGPPIGLPADLVRRRPDLRQAEAGLVRAVAEIGVQRAELYPSLRIPGRIDVDLTLQDELIEKATGVLTAVIDVPLFDSGRRRAEVRAAVQRARAQAVRYKQTLIASIGEAENALAAVHGLETRRLQLERTVAASEAAFERVFELYLRNEAAFLDLQGALGALLADRAALIDAEAALAASVVALYAAVAAPTSLP